MVSLFSAKKAHVVSKRLDDFRERTQPQLGKVHDPIAETLDVEENHTFGVMVKADDFSESMLRINNHRGENYSTIAFFRGSGNLTILQHLRLL